MTKLRDALTRFMYALRNTSIRRMVAAGLALICIASFVSVYINYTTSQDALDQSQKAYRLSEKQRDQRTKDRKRVDLQTCRQIKSLRAINNRDRETFKAALSANLAAKPELKKFVSQLTSEDGRKIGDLLLGLIENGIASDRAELKVRPHLADVNCLNLVNPPKKTPAKTPPTTTSHK